MPATVRAGKGAALAPQAGIKGGAGTPATVQAGKGAAATGRDQAPAAAESDSAYLAVISSAKGIGELHKEHPPAQGKAQEAQAAAESPSNEVDSKAQANQVGEMGQAETPEFDAAGFKAKLMARIADMAPKNLQEADDFKNNNQLDSVKGELSGQVKEEQKASKDPLEEKAKETPDTSGIEAKQVTPLPPNDPGAAPSDIGADKAAPKPKGEGEVEAPLQAESQKLDQQMAEANVTEEQLSNSNEPEFQGALTAKKEAQTSAAQAPQEYRQQEEGLISNAKNTAVSTAQQLLQAMHGTRTQSLGQVATQQTEAKGKDEQARTKIAGDINKIYENTKTKVEQSLADLDSLVLQGFDTGAGEAKKAFEDYVKQKMDAYKDERYSGVTGKLQWVEDLFKGLPSEVNAFYEQGRQLYIAKMDGVINNVVAIVSKGITKAKTEITNGKQEIQTYIQQLPEDLKAVGQEAAAEIQTKFDDLQQQVNDKQDELVNTLAEKYQENLQAVDDSIEKMKSENKGLLQKAADAFMGVIKTILEMKDLLLSALAGAAAAVMDILKNPIQFLTNFIQAVKQGFLNFVNNIGQYLQQGLMGWLVGTIGGAGLQMPESFDVKGIFSLVTQVLGFSYDFIRGRAANKLGEEKVAYLEQSEETFKVLPTQGLAGIWHLIQDKIGDLKTTVMDGIQNFVMTSIVQAGVEWVLSLLTPASAFVKACKMIIDIVKFFIERGSQIAALIGAVTSSISAIASGAVGEAIQAIESALARSLPVALGFLASLLGLGGISQKIQGIIQKVRQPVTKAVDWVIDKGAKVANKVGGKFNKTKFGSKVVGVKNAAQEKYKAGKKFVEDKKAAGEKFFDDKKQAVHQATEKQKNRLLNTKAGKALTSVKDAAHKKLDALEKKRQVFKNKIDAAKEWPGKQLEKVQDKAAELGGRAKDKFKQSKLGKGFANQLEKAKNWGGKKKAAVEDKFDKLGNKVKDKFGFGKDKDKDKANKKAETTSPAEQKKHEAIADKIYERLKPDQQKSGGVNQYLKLKQKEANELKKIYSPQLRKGIKLFIDLTKSKQTDKQTPGLHLHIAIKPNDTEKDYELFHKEGELDNHLDELIEQALGKITKHFYRGQSKTENQEENQDSSKLPEGIQTTIARIQADYGNATRGTENVITVGGNKFFIDQNRNNYVYPLQVATKAGITTTKDGKLTTQKEVSGFEYSRFTNVTVGQLFALLENIRFGKNTAIDRTAMLIASLAAEPFRYPPSHITNLILLNNSNKTMPAFATMAMTTGGTDPTSQDQAPQGIDTKKSKKGQKNKAQETEQQTPKGTVPNKVRRRQIDIVKNVNIVKNDEKLYDKLEIYYNTNRSKNDSEIIEKFQDILRDHLTPEY
ncbi:hypothetical protein Cylst_4103 [Cylindrospermum stagnale PCC 7417]|uniref:Uncharacterized protein n=1 Tax=Cylindrospermum stagnale PCC 7417 TaxID=56107 RepID=K9X2A7_9NOST|nr:hypothetical protein [Cylindrospermum stagnale]AFZ26209.1 hypothetical protein Cylst_4103 [Cylindrospermum stagnale PCC 7417]